MTKAIHVIPILREVILPLMIRSPTEDVIVPSAQSGSGDEGNCTTSRRRQRVRLGEHACCGGLNPPWGVRRGCSTADKGRFDPVEAVLDVAVVAEVHDEVEALGRGGVGVGGVG